MLGPGYQLGRSLASRAPLSVVLTLRANLQALGGFLRLVGGWADRQPMIESKGALGLA